MVVIEKHKHTHALFLTFIDLEKAYDSVPVINCENLWQTLR
jgi:hypothetical protein